MTGRPAPSVFTIPAGVSFVDALAAGIAGRVGDDPLALAGVTVLLPTRRAGRALREAFLRRCDGRPMLLPRMMPLSDVDADALALAGGGLAGVAGAMDLPEAVSGLRRQILLTRAVSAAEGLAATLPQAARLAADLARLVDEVHTEGADFQALGRLVPDTYAEHWQVTLQFLRIVTEAWPAILAEEGRVDPARRRNCLLEAQAAAWTAAPPREPVFAAGSTGSIPAAAGLLAVVARLPQGAVVLPGLDLEADAPTWEAIRADEGHPQHDMARLLDRLEVERAGVRPWLAGPPPRRERARLMAEALRPAATTEVWRALEPADGAAGLAAEPVDGAAGLAAGAALDGVARIDAAGPEEEATAVALILREALETPGRTAALVTADRTLARRVGAALGRWGILVDDSAGRPLADSAVGTYLRLTAAFAARSGEPLALLTLAKHPLSAGGQPPGDFRTAARALERAVLRGPRPGDGLPGLLAALAAAEARGFTRTHPRDALLTWVGHLARLSGEVMALMSRQAPLVDLVRAHVAFAEALAASDSETGAERLWRQDDGEEAAAFIHELMDAAEGFPAVAGTDYPSVLEALMMGRSVRPRFGLHPRLHVLGPMEARLQHFDVMVLGGLNEGTWPANPAADPWMSRPMRRDFGLPGPERMIGIAAHDFMHACGAPEVVLTRAERVDGTPTVPSRWLMRLETVLKALRVEGRLEAAGHHRLVWARAIDTPAQVRPAEPPEPRPPVAARPRALSVTRIETWMRDPYAIYARFILNLIKLEPIAADPGAAERGQFIHAALDAFVRAFPGPLPDDALTRLLELGRDGFGSLLDSHPDVRAFWWPRFERIAAWFVTLERERRLTVRPLATEVAGRLELAAPGGTFVLTATADRIDRTNEGQLLIIDYKTGQVPSRREVELGFAPQLPLEAAIALAGGFQGVPAGPLAGLAHWRLSGGQPAGEDMPLKGDPQAMAQSALEGLAELVRRFDDDTTPYRSCPRPGHAPRFTDYAHLARVQEWSAGGGTDGES